MNSGDIVGIAWQPETGWGAGILYFIVGAPGAMYLSLTFPERTHVLDGEAIPAGKAWQYEMSLS